MQLSKRPNRKGGFVWTIRWNVGKKQYQKTLKGIESQEMAEMALADLKRQRERGALDLPTDPTYSLREALDDLVDQKRGLVKDQQTTQYEFMANRLCRILGDNVPVGKLDKGDVGRVRQQLRTDSLEEARGRRTRGLNPPTINKNIGFLIAAVDLAVKQGKIARNPIAGCERVSDDRAPRWRFLSEDEIATLYAALGKGYKVTNRSRMGNEYQTHYDAPEGLRELVTFLLNTGARLGEALAVTWRDVDFKAGHVRLITTKKAARGRSAVPRYIPMNDALRALLKGLDKTKASADAPVLTIDRNNLLRKFQNLCERIGLGHVRPHDLRHTFCSHLAMAGVPIPTIKDLAGHSTINMTMRYSHLLPGANQKAVDALNFGAKRGKKAQVVDMAG